MDFSFNTPNISYVIILLSVAFVLIVVCSIIMWVRSVKIRRFIRDEESRTYLGWKRTAPQPVAENVESTDEAAEDAPAEEEVPPLPVGQTSSSLPGVSVVVYAHNDAETLERFLPLILHQDYPTFEVIVVDDGSYDDSRDILSDMLPHFDNLRVTFSPDNTRALSRKKLSLTIGFKAAKYDIVLTTNANCRVMSDQWLRLMMRNFVPGTDVVLGFSHYRYRKDKTAGRFFRIYDSVIVALEWLCSAISGHPYRGVSDNLAYRKKVFFDHSGFSKTLDLRYGDDDVYLKEIAHGGNTRVELAPESQVQTYYDDVPHAHHLLKLRRDFTNRQVSQRAFLLQSFFSWCNYLSLAAIIAAVVLDFTNIFTISVAVVLLLLSWLMMILPFNRCCQALQAPGLTFSVPLFNLWRPVVNLFYRIRGIATRKDNYTSMYD